MRNGASKSRYLDWDGLGHVSSVFASPLTNSAAGAFEIRQDANTAKSDNTRFVDFGC